MPVMNDVSLYSIAGGMNSRIDTKQIRNQIIYKMTVTVVITMINK